VVNGLNRSGSRSSGMGFDGIVVAGLDRPSASFLPNWSKDVDARDKRGHDECVVLTK
jgi:hypothetical protein